MEIKQIKTVTGYEENIRKKTMLRFLPGRSALFSCLRAVNVATNIPFELLVSTQVPAEAVTPLSVTVVDTQTAKSTEKSNVVKSRRVLSNILMNL